MSTHKSFNFVTVCLAVALCLSAATALAETITWTLEQMTTATTDSIVRNTSDAVYKVYNVALNVGDDTAATVNGVSFLADNTFPLTATANGVTINIPSAGTTGGCGDTGDEGNRYSPSLEDVMETVIASRKANETAPHEISVGLSGLTSGAQYRVQFLIDQSGESSNNIRDMEIVNGTSHSGWFGVGATAPGNHGESVLAEFTASSSLTTFTLFPKEGDDRAVLNGVSVFTVPEPGTLLLLVTGLVMLLGFYGMRRRRS